MLENEQDYIRTDPEQLKAAVTGLLKRYQVPEDHARLVSDVLVAADLRGIESHGVGRLNSYYLQRLKKGLTKPDPEIKTIADLGATFVLDADNGLGHPPSYQAMEKCIELAERYGVGLGGVRNSNHFGIAGYYSMMALEKDMIGICMCNTQPAILPTYSRKKLLGTNPISIAVPAGDQYPYVLDMATSIVPLGKLQVHQRLGLPIPEGWGADGKGKTTTDPVAALEVGGLYPLGGPAETAGYKGYGLAAAIDIFSGVLTGTGFLTGVLPAQKSTEPCSIGHFMGAIKVDAFMEPGAFKERMDAFIHNLQNAPLAEDCEKIYVAGEKEFLQWEENMKKGAPVLPAVWSELLELCREHDLTPPEAFS